MENQETNVLLSSAYLAPIQYYTKIIGYTHIYIEYLESYLKQSYRNRTVILAANGPLQLTLPIVNGPRAKGPIRDQQLCYDYPWQQMHWRGISSAYNNSPFFEYYADDFAPFFHEKRSKYLIDFNQEIQNVVLEATGIKADLKFTKEYLPIGEVPPDLDDFRYSIHPKPQKQIEDERFIPDPYIQVFNEKCGFVPNLSILDLLFNEGPETAGYLRSSFK
jgi:hypothetical protein